VPILLCTLGFTMMVNPFFMFMAFMVPTVVITEEFFGNEMREAFCDTQGSEIAATLAFVKSAPFMQLATIIGALLAATVVTFCVSGIFFKDPLKSNLPKGTRVTHSRAFMMVHGAKAFLVRASTVVVMYAGFLALVTFVQMIAFREKHSSSRLIDRYCPGGTFFPSNCTDPGTNGCLPTGSSGVLQLFGLIFVVAVLVMPYIGSGVAIGLACLTGPLVIIIVLARLIMFRVFGVLTGQQFLARAGPGFDQAWWDTFAGTLLFLAVILLPFYNTFRSALHTYYMRCLSHNFFAHGADRPLTRLKETPYCPLVLVTGTSSDYQSPFVGDHDVISELSFTPLHCGSLETGYVPQPFYRTMGKCTALTAAGCIDAVALTLSNLLTLRFWLEVLNLSWGDYIIFSPKNVEGQLGKTLTDLVMKLPPALQGAAVRSIDRLVSTVVISIIWLLFYLGFVFGNADLYKLGLISFAAVFALSLSQTGSLSEEMCQSPWLRQMQQATGHHHRGNRPPAMLYVTDGGCRDCITLTQLCLRRKERILMVLAASDTHDELGVLKTAIGIVSDLGLANFYDPRDPRRDLRCLFTEYQADRSIVTLHIGIYYYETAEEPAKTGHLYIVKNRLPPSHEGKKVEPHITQEEMIGECERGMGPAPLGDKMFDPAHWRDMNTDQLGSLCCCDSSHTNGVCGNCGPKFPHGSFANFMYMTPMWCSSLARLAFDVSEEPVRRATQTDAHGAEWENHVDVIGSQAHASAAQNRQRPRRHHPGRSPRSPKKAR